MAPDDLRRVCGPLPLDLWLDLSTFVVCWEAAEVACHMVSLGEEPGDEHDRDINEDAQRRLREIARCLSEQAAEVRRWAPKYDDEHEREHRQETLAECADLERRVLAVVATVSLTSKGGDA